jgi:hypothetical protein
MQAGRNTTLDSRAVTSQSSCRLAPPRKHSSSCLCRSCPLISPDFRPAGVACLTNQLRRMGSCLERIFPAALTGAVCWSGSSMASTTCQLRSFCCVCRMRKARIRHRHGRCGWPAQLANNSTSPACSLRKRLGCACMECNKKRGPEEPP